MTQTLAISHWHGLAPGLSTPDAWQSWAAGAVVQDDALPAFARIPAMLRRRMSTASRMAVETALTLAERAQCGYGIFVSRHGELVRMMRLIAQVNGREPLSPTEFSQSVHNTAAGLFTIAAQLRMPVTSISAGRDGFQQAIVEALACLHGGSTERVLLVAYDEHPPEEYKPLMDERTACYALGLVLERGDQWSVRGRPGGTLGPDDPPQTIQFLKSWLSGSRTFEIGGPSESWTWESLS